MEDEAGDDHGRALNPRGVEDATALGRWLATQVPPGQVFCSTARRTRETLAAFHQNWPTILRDKLYLASAGELLAQIHSADDAVCDLMLIAHNPGMHGLLALLAGEYAHERDAERVTMKFPTSACAMLTTDTAHWRDIGPHSMRLELLRWQAES